VTHTPPARVVISPRDPRYFELADGRPYVPIGLNLVEPPAGKGLPELTAWMAKLAAHRGNYCRLWLGCEFFDLECRQSGQIDEDRAARVDAAVEAAARHGLRVKVCIDQFRRIPPCGDPPFDKPVHHVSRGGFCETTADFFDSARGRAQFVAKLAWLAERYGNHRHIYGWELWNEIDCIERGDWIDWTRVMLRELRHRMPEALAMQSLGSLDRAARRRSYHALAALADNQVVQVHRYLDPGAEIVECRGPADLLASTAIAELRPLARERPVVLAETGAVEARHSGPSRLYRRDAEGTLLHDLLFAPFMSGAAGPGQPWHWDAYVDRMNLWYHFDRFAEAIDGIDVPAERFEPLSIPHDRVRILALAGRRTTLLWCRDGGCDWRTELEEGRPAARLSSIRVACPATNGADRMEIRAYDPWTARWDEVKRTNGLVTLPDFSRSLFVKAVARP
jgi:hypothetical protein